MPTKTNACPHTAAFTVFRWDTKPARGFFSQGRYCPDCYPPLMPRLKRRKKEPVEP